MRLPRGTTRLLELSAVANVSPSLHLATLRDITDHVGAEDAVRRSEVRFRAMIEKGQDGIMLLSADARTLYQSPAVERLLGYGLDEAKQMSWQDFVDEKERPKLASALAKLMEGRGSTAALEFRIRRRDGSRCWLELTATNWLDDPNIGAIVSNFRDITQRKALEEERDGFFRLSLDLLCIAGIDGQFRTLNPAWETTLGWSLDELCTRPWLDFVHPDDYEATLQQGAKLAEGRVVIRYENRYRCKDGSYRWLEWACIPTSDGLIYACAHDVTDERATAERARLLFAASPLPMLLVDAQTLRLFDANDVSVRAYEYVRDELLSLTLDDIVVEEQRHALRSAFSQLAEGTGTVTVHDRQHRTKSGERRHVQVTSDRLKVDGRDAILKVIVNYTKAGAPFWLEPNVAPVHNDAGELTHFVAIQRDITEQHHAREALRRSDERLRQAQKMEAIGSLVGGIAHDFNNLLSVILSYTEMMIEDLPAADPLKADIEEIVHHGVLDAGIEFLLKPILSHLLPKKVRDVLGGRSRPITWTPR